MMILKATEDFAEIDDSSVSFTSDMMAQYNTCITKFLSSIAATEFLAQVAPLLAENLYPDHPQLHHWPMHWAAGRCHRVQPGGEADTAAYKHLPPTTTLRRRPARNGAKQQL